MFRVLGIGSSIRKASRHNNLLQFLKQNPPRGVSVEVADLASLPLYNADYFIRKPPPALPDKPYFACMPYALQKFQNQVQYCDAIIFAATEFPEGISYGVPGVLKNALDWAAGLTTLPLQQEKPSQQGRQAEDLHHSAMWGFNLFESKPCCTISIADLLPAVAGSAPGAINPPLVGFQHHQHDLSHSSTCIQRGVAAPELRRLCIQLGMKCLPREDNFAIYTNADHFLEPADAVAATDASLREIQEIPGKVVLRLLQAHRRGAESGVAVTMDPDAACPGAGVAAGEAWGTCAPSSPATSPSPGAYRVVNGHTTTRAPGEHLDSGRGENVGSEHGRDPSTDKGAAEAAMVAAFAKSRHARPEQRMDPSLPESTVHPTGTAPLQASSTARGKERGTFHSPCYIPGTSLQGVHANGSGEGVGDGEMGSEGAGSLPAAPTAVKDGEGDDEVDFEEDFEEDAEWASEWADDDEGDAEGAEALDRNPPRFNQIPQSYQHDLQQQRISTPPNSDGQTRPPSVRQGWYISIRPHTVNRLGMPFWRRIPHRGIAASEWMRSYSTTTTTPHSGVRAISSSGGAVDTSSGSKEERDSSTHRVFCGTMVGDLSSDPIAKGGIGAANPSEMRPIDSAASFSTGRLDRSGASRMVSSSWFDSNKPPKMKMSNESTATSPPSGSGGVGGDGSSGGRSLMPAQVSAVNSVIIADRSSKLMHSSTSREGCPNKQQPVTRLYGWLSGGPGSRIGQTYGSTTTTSRSRSDESGDTHQGPTAFANSRAGFDESPSNSSYSSYVFLPPGTFGTGADMRKYMYQQGEPVKMSIKGETRGTGAAVAGESRKGDPFAFVSVSASTGDEGENNNAERTSSHSSSTSTTSDTSENAEENSTTLTSTATATATATATSKRLNKSLPAEPTPAPASTPAPTVKNISSAEPPPAPITHPLLPCATRSMGPIRWVTSTHYPNSYNNNSGCGDNDNAASYMEGCDLLPSRKISFHDPNERSVGRFFSDFCPSQAPQGPIF